MFVDIRRKTMRHQCGQNEEHQIGFDDMRSFQVLKKQRMTLKKSDDRIDQIGEENRKRKDDDNRSRDIESAKHVRKSEGCEQDV